VYIKELSLKNFRNIESIKLMPDRETNIFYGDNAQGKTNIMEAVYMCAAGRSHRTHIEKELIKFGEQSAHIQLFAQRTDFGERIDIHIKNDQKKGVAVGGIPVKKLGELFGAVNVVFFGPEDLMLVKEGPNLRRKFMDMEMCQTSKVYYYNLQQYYKTLRQRNEFLKKCQATKNQAKPDITMLEVWDEQLVGYGVKLVVARKEFINQLNTTAGSIHHSITSGKECLSVEYKPSVDELNFADKIRSNHDRDIYYGTTNSGIHKDDIVFYVNGVNARNYGSQGQQRTVCLSLKLAEVEMIKQQVGESPVLLLDDVLSELDRSRQMYIISCLDGIQTFITCTGIDEVIGLVADKSAVFHVKNGEIVRDVRTEVQE
jgi:DNA replication and repair protein RecF